MAVLNGKLPDALLTFLPWAEADHLRCRIDAAASLGRLAAAFEAHFGKPLIISDGYRTFDEQVALKKVKKTFAAKPGTSNHGLGVAVDAASRINVDDSSEHKWMEHNGPSFGWINPPWAVNLDPSDGEHEPWHWEYHPELDIQPAPLTTLEDDMAGEGPAILAIAQNIENLLAHGSQSGGGIRGDVLAGNAAIDTVGTSLQALAENLQAGRADVNTVANELRALARALGHPVA